MPNVRARKLPVACRKRGCRGILFDVTPVLAVALGVKHVECDRCHERLAFKISDKE